MFGYTLEDLQKESGSQTAERRIIRKGGTLFCIVNTEQQG